jgi:hypothetical protein
MLGVQKMVLEKIRQMDRGTIFFIDDFIELGSSGAVRIALMELKKQGIILRLARGIYCYPQIRSEYSGYITPTPETIADTLAKKERVRIIPYGDNAAYKLGLTGLQVSNLKYLTDGASRVINLSSGKKIIFNHTSEVKIFDFCNETMQMVSAAIRALTEEYLDGEKKRIIHQHLRAVPEEEFRKDITIPPAWVGKIILEIWNN